MTILRKIGIPVIQLLLGSIFLFSGFVKVIDPVGSTIKMEDYAVAFGVDMPHAFILLLAVGQGLFEFLLGFWLILGIWKKTAGWLVLLFMAIMTPFTLYLAIANPVSDCGCFGDAVKLTNWETFIKNSVLLSFAILYLRCRDSALSFYGRRTGRWCSYWCLIFSLLLSIHSYRHQPLIDFMPFKTGNDLYELTHLPETAVTDSIEYRFTYEKDGVRKIVTAGNLPASGSGWNYVDRTQVLIRKGDEPVISNLAILHPSLGDLTESILRDTSYVFLFVSPKLETSERQHVTDAVNAYKYARQYDYAFYGLTSSAPEAIEEWQYEYDSDVEFCASDDRLLTTMIRTNPGLVLLKNGVVYRKWSFRDIPEFKNLDKPLNESSIGRMRKQNILRVLGLTVVCFAFPLLFFYLLRTGQLARLKHFHLLNPLHHTK